MDREFLDTGYWNLTCICYLCVSVISILTASFEVESLQPVLLSILKLIEAERANIWDISFQCSLELIKTELGSLESYDLDLQLNSSSYWLNFNHEQ